MDGFDIIIVGAGTAGMPCAMEAVAGGALKMYRISTE